MPRKQYVADFKSTQDGTLPLGVSNLRQGEDDGQFLFEFSGTPTSPFPESVTITALVPDLGDYPKSHDYMIFCGENAPPHIASAISSISDTSTTHRKTVFEVIDIVAASLARLSLDSDGDSAMPDSQLDDDEDDYADEDEDDEDVYGSDHEAFDMGPQQHTAPYSAPPAHVKLEPADRNFRARIRADMVAAKNAGFKVGHLGGLMAGYNSFVTISIRISKLGISEEAMQAWQVTPTDYLILIIQYPNGYKANEELQAIESHRMHANLAMRVCVGKKYKPTLQDAIKAFTIVKKNDRESISSTDLPSAQDEVDEDSIREAFISRPLQTLLQERLVQIIRYRSAGMDWLGAEEWYIEVASQGASGADAVPDHYFQPEVVSSTLPQVVTADHYTQRNAFNLSFPLLAMQFTLRHFVRCTEFCLVCHRRLSDDLEAIKPYVCDSSLCLYQYMTLGFGPSIEHEILTQPYVVDLLTSFCYNSAFSRKLKEFPDGLALMVPQPDASKAHAADANPYYYGRGNHAPPPKKDVPALPTYEVGFDRRQGEVIFFVPPERCPVRKGSWIVLKETNSANDEELHCRVEEVDYFPTIKVNSPVVIRAGETQSAPSDAADTGTSNTPITPGHTPKWAPAIFQVYEQDFDQLDTYSKCYAIRKLLQTLPSVTVMREHLLKKRPADLKYWVERISPAALSLLRWIIASNRACIMQVDGDSNSGTAPQERLYGMKDHMQFRFAMGAPDKEQRFISEVRKTVERLNLAHPTIFAFHGSPLYNWHMIIREGLHYKNLDHGRAFGHGVYHAKEAQTSSGYSGMAYGGYRAQGKDAGTWPNSVLNISSALALNEIVNAPAEFTSNNPYYVVQHLDWIQTRYLFVQCQPTSEDLKPRPEQRPLNAHPQDPQRTPRGISDNIVIPASAITSGRAVLNTARAPKQSKSWQSPLKKLKGLGGAVDPVVIDDDDDSASQATDAEDLEILFDEAPEPEPEPERERTDSHANAEGQKYNIGNTDFEPGTLDFATLPLMPTPEYAVSGTTRSLMKELQRLAKIQESTPLSDLGWFIDTEKIENVYQWIVELHSFHVIDPTLPLVADMKKQKVKSIVLEIRFNRDFPFSPPYVRVIRPRFLSRVQGGGGHIVMGGAMCMELLTNTGWVAASSMESVLMQIRLAIASEPPARMDTHGRGDYGIGEAADGYIRACQTHGWTVPEGFKEMAYGSSAGSASGAY
jgi:ubiquitin-conjugating enzyme E2 Q